MSFQGEGFLVQHWGRDTKCLGLSDVCHSGQDKVFGVLELFLAVYLNSEGDYCKFALWFAVPFSDEVQVNKFKQG